MDQHININDPDQPVIDVSYSDFSALLGAPVFVTPADVDVDPELGIRHVSVVKLHGTGPKYGAFLSGMEQTPYFHRAPNFVSFCQDVSDFYNGMVFAEELKTLHDQIVENGWLDIGSASHRSLATTFMRIEFDIPQLLANNVYNATFGHLLPEQECPVEDCCWAEDDDEPEIKRITIETSFDEDSGHLTLLGTHRQVEQAKQALLDAAAKLTS